MTRYKCGHKGDEAIFMDDNPLSFASWWEWKETVGYEGDKSLCFDCFCKKIANKEGE